MYSITVSHHFMAAHSSCAGPSSDRHSSCTARPLRSRPNFAEMRSTPMASCATSVALFELLQAVLGEIDYRNLDEVAEFRGRNTTTEFLAGEIHRRLARRVREGALGPHAAAAISSLRVVLRETPVAWAAYDAPLE